MYMDDRVTRSGVESSGSDDAVPMLSAEVSQRMDKVGEEEMADSSDE